MLGGADTSGGGRRRDWSDTADAKRPTPSVTRGGPAGGGGADAGGSESWSRAMNTGGRLARPYMEGSLLDTGWRMGLPAGRASVFQISATMALALAAVVGSRAQQEHGKHALACCLHPASDGRGDRVWHHGTHTNAHPAPRCRLEGRSSWWLGRWWTRLTYARVRWCPASHPT